MRSALVALAACGAPDPGLHPGATSSAKDQEPPAPAPACVPSQDAAVISHATAEGGRVMYCVGGDNACFAMDLASGALTRMSAPPADPPGGGAKVKTTSPEIEVCSGGECKQLTPKILPGASPIHAVTNSAGTVFVLLLGDAEGGKGYAEIWDVAKQRRTATFKYARGDYRCGELAMLGETVLVNASNCSGPTARATLWTVKGAKIGNVGKGDFGTFGNARAQLTLTDWAFLDENGNKLAIQDVQKGKVKRVLDVSALWRDEGSAVKDALGTPGESALVRVDDDHLAVIAGSPHEGSVGIVDLASGDLRVLPAAHCK